jgi:hypothetical protein
MHKRTAFVLTADINSDRVIFSKKILEEIGFDVKVISCIVHNDKVASNKFSMQYIYSLIKDLDENYAYVFEDDINILEEIKLAEIIEYENISEMFFYLGLCEIPGSYGNKTNIQIKNHPVFTKSGDVRCLHAIGLSKKGAAELLEFSKQSGRSYMDMILEDFSVLYPANVVRYDLESYISGHKGVIFQDRNVFPSNIC